MAAGKAVNPGKSAHAHRPEEKIRKIITKKIR